MASNRLEILLEVAGKRAVDQAFKGVEESADKMARGVRDKMLQAGAAVAATGVAATVVGKNFVDAAADQQQYEIQLKQLTGGAEQARERLAKLNEMADKTVFDTDQLVEADIKFKNLGVDADRFLGLTGDLTFMMGGTLPENAGFMTRALKGQAEAINVLNERFGISKDKLEEFGARADSQGNILVESAEDAEKLAKAMEKVIKTSREEGGLGISGTEADQAASIDAAFSNLEGTFTRLKAAVGEKLAPAFTAAAGYVTTFLQSLTAAIKGMPAGTEGLLKWAGIAAVAVLGVGSAVAGLTAVLLPMGATLAITATKGALVTAMVKGLIASIQGYRAAQLAATQAGVVATASEKALAGARAGGQAVVASLSKSIQILNVSTMASVACFGLALAAIGALAVGVHLYTEELKAADQAAQNLLKIEEQRAAWLREEKGLLGASAEEFRKRGKTSKDAQELILALDDQIEEARKRGDTAAEARHKAERQRLMGVRKELATTEQAAREEADKTAGVRNLTGKRAEQAVEDWRKKASNAAFATKEEELAALDEIMARLDQSNQKYKDLAYERIKLAQEVRKESLSNALDAIAQEEAAGNVSKEEEAKRLRELAQEYGDLVDEKKKLIADATRLEREAAQEQADAYAATQESLLELASTRLASAQEALKQSNNLQQSEKEVTRLLKERQKAEEEAINARLSADKAKETDPKVRAQLEQQADAEIKASRLRLAQDQKKLIQEVAAQEKQLIDLKVKSIEAERSAADATIRTLEERLGKGEDVLEQLGKEIEARAKLEEKAIREQAAAESKGKTAAQIAEIEAQAEAKIQALHTETDRVLNKLSQDALEREKKMALERIEIAKKELDEKIAALEDKQDQGMDVSAQMQGLLRQQLELEKQRIEAQKELNNLGQAAEQQALNTKDAQIEITTATRETEKSIRSIAGDQKKIADDSGRERDNRKSSSRSAQGQASSSADQSAANERGFHATSTFSEDSGSISSFYNQLDDAAEAEEARREAVDRANVAEGDRMGKTRSGKTAAEIRRAERIAEIESKRAADMAARQDKANKDFDERLADAKDHSDAVTNSEPWQADSGPPREQAGPVELSPATIQALGAAVAQAQAQNPQSVEIMVSGKDLGVDWKSNYSLEGRSSRPDGSHSYRNVTDRDRVSCRILLPGRRASRSSRPRRTRRPRTRPARVEEPRLAPEPEPASHQRACLPILSVPVSEAMLAQGEDLLEPSLPQRRWADPMQE